MRDGYASDAVRQAANVVGAVFQILAAVLAGPAIGRVAAEYETFVTPAGYAFAIWTPIFTLSLVYAVYAAFPARREDPLLRRIGWFTAAAFLLNGAWEILFPLERLIAAQAVLLGVLVASGVAYLLVQRQVSSTRSNVALSGGLLVAPTVGLLFGWVTAATLVGLASLALLAGRIGPRLGYLAYAAAFLWALVGVSVAQYEEFALTSVVAAATALCVALVSVSVVREVRAARRKPRTPRVR